MTQVYNDKNLVVPVTKVLVEPNFITQIKTKEKEGANAIQVSFSTKKHLSKPLLGHYKELGSFQFSRDFLIDDVSPYKVGDEVKVDSFVENDEVSVTGTSKGHVFSGLVKSHRFAGHNATRGTKEQ